MAFTKKDYGRYRLLVTSRVKSPTASPTSNNTNMLGIEIWGARHNGDFNPRGTIHVIPPLMWIWDYLNNKEVDAVRPVYTDPGFSWNAWNTEEILSDVNAGKFRMAVNGVEVLAFTANVLKDWHVGPVGVLVHNSTSVVQYKDIKIEENPANFDLTTLKP